MFEGALTAVSSGAAEIAVVYHSDAALVKGLRLMFQLPRSCIPDIKYVATTLSDATNPEMAAAFLAFCRRFYTVSPVDQIWI